jgi:HEPN domain-containing protein
MKAVLIDRKVIVPRTHNLVELHHLLHRAEPTWIWAEPELEWLSRAAVNYRYPGNSATRAHAKRALDICRRLKERLLGMIV